MPQWLFQRRSTIGLLVSLVVAAIVMGAPQARGAAVDHERSEASFQQAREHVAKGNFDAAIIELKNSLQSNADNVAARKLLGQIYLKVGNGPYAEKEISAARRRGATDPATAVLYARALLMQAKFDDVLRNVPDESQDPELRVETLIVRGQALLGLRRFDEADRAFREASGLSPEDARPRIGLAQILVNRGDLKGAEETIDKVLSGQSKIAEALALTAAERRMRRDLDEAVGQGAEALVLKAELLRQRRDLENAVLQYGKASALRPNNLFARLGRAAALVELNRDEEAQKDLEPILKQFRRHPLAQYLTALILARKKDFEGSLSALNIAGPTLDRHLPSVFLAGAAHYSLGQFEQAISKLDRYVSARPDNARARKLLGAALVRIKEPEQAVRVLRPLIEGGSRDVQLLSLLGSAHMQLGNFSEGADYFRQASELAPDLATIRTQLAIGDIAQGKADDAVSQLQRALDLDPDAHRAAVLLTLVRLRQKDYDAALEAAKNLRKQMPDNPLPLNLIGAAQLGSGDIAAARRTFEEILERYADFHPARMNLAQIEHRNGNLSGARAQYDQILERNDKHIGAMTALADMALRDGRQAEAESWLRKAIAANPKSLVPALRLISLYGRTRQVDKALAVARELNQNLPDNPSVLEVLGRAETAAGKPILAATTFSRLASLKPNSARILGLVAGAQISAKDMAAARATLNRAQALDENYLPVQIALVEVELRSGNFARAMEIAASLRQRNPSSPVGDMMVGDVLMRQGRFPEAVAAFEAGFAKAPGSALAIRRFNAQRKAEGSDKALDVLQEWVDEKNDRAARHVLASAYIAASKFDRAIREAEVLLVDEPDSPVLLNNLAWLYQQKGDHRALAFAERALEKAPQSPAIMDTLGWILIETGDVDRAVTLLRDAKSLAPRQGDIHYHLAVALHRSGRSDEARRELQDLLDSQIRFSKLEAARALLSELRGG